MIDDRTSFLDLPLPNQSNRLLDDVGRIRNSLTEIDTHLSNNTVTNIATLRLTTRGVSVKVSTQGYYTAGDGGHGLYWYDSTDTTTADNGGSVIVGADGARWKLMPVNGAVSARQFGAKFDGVTNDSVANNNALSYVKANGLHLDFPAGITRSQNLRIDGGLTFWSMSGAGKGCTIIRSADGGGSTLNGSEGNVGGFKISDLTIDSMWAEYAHVSAHSGLSYSKTSNSLIEKVESINFKNNGIIFYDDDATGLYSHNSFVDCDAVGDGAVSGNGLLIVNSANSSIIRGSAIGCLGVPEVTPGIGIQLKNLCPQSFILDSWASGCRTAIGFGNDASAGVVGMTDSYVSNAKSFNCEAAFLGLEISSCAIHFSYVDMNNFTGYAITCGGGNNGNTYNIDVAENIASNRAVFRFNDTSNGNMGHVGVAKNRNSTGYIAEFSDTATNNHVTFGTLSSPANHPNGFRSLAGWNATTGNSLSSVALPAIYRATVVAATTLVLQNTKAQTVELLNSASAASLDLANIAAGVQGQTVRLRTASNAQDVVVKHGTGNILLSGLADFTLSHAADSLTLEYSPVVSAWCEVSRADCGV